MAERENRVSPLAALGDGLLLLCALLGLKIGRAHV